VVHKGVAKVHVSGHASGGELLYLLNATKPSNVMPVHGEWRHLRAHAELGRQSGVPAERIVLAEDGFVVDLVDGKASIVGAVPCGYVYVDGLEVGDVSETTLKDRRILGEEGFISIFAVVDTGTGRVLAGPHLHARGFAESDDVFEELVPQVTVAIEAATAGGAVDVVQLQQVVRQVVGRWVSSRFKRRPLIFPVVVPA
ncbi:MAG: RNase J family beta-CASP ribonuclease, partial [Cellulomonas sp.]|nr:RNase J family beta-CASP ribonuclease [Cellulomonas sp.]